MFIVRKYIDDALDVFALHGVGGIIGSILVGVFAATLWNHTGPSGLIESGSFLQIGKQFTAVMLASVWSAIFTFLILMIINFITPVRLSKESQNDIDMMIFSEDAYKN